VDLFGTCPQSSRVPVSVTVHDPSLFSATVLAEHLKAAGIRVKGEVLRDRTIRVALANPSLNPPTTASATAPAAARVASASVGPATTQAAATQAATEPAFKLLAVHETPIMQVISRANKDSVNLYAECLSKRLGFAATGQ